MSEIRAKAEPGAFLMQRTQAIIRQPSMRIAEGEVTHIDRVPMDVARGFEQHRSYVELLQRHGLGIVEAPAAPEHPDGLFVEDALVMIDAVAIITRPGALSRRGETASIRAVVESLGLRDFSIASPATVDGGDVLVTDRHVFVGQTTRSNAAAVQQFDRICRPLKRHALGAKVQGCLHLKSAVTALPDGSLIAVDGWVDVEWFRDLGYRVHVTADTSGGDVLCIGSTVVLPADAQRAAAQISDLGFPVETLDVSELQKIEAGVTCLSVLV